MKCPHCDQEHGEGTSFCPYTGKQILSNISCPNCGEVYDTQLSACPKCGTPSALYQPPETQQAVKQIPEGMDNTILIQASKASPSGSATAETADQVGQQANSLPEQEALPSQHQAQPIQAAISTPEPAAPAGTSVQPAGSGMKPTHRITIGCFACGCVGIPLVFMLSLVFTVLVDPFNIHIWGRLNGSYDAAAEVMPADTGVYLSLNIGNALLTRVDNRLAPFTPSDATTKSSLGYEFSHVEVDPSQAEQLGLFTDLLRQIEQETGVKIPDDISPWVGQYAGIGAMGFHLDDFGALVPTGWMVALEARNLWRADAFLESVQGDLTDMQNMNFSRQSYNGVPIFVQLTSGGESGVSFGRSGRMVLVASDLEILKNAIDHPGNQSLSTQVEYSRLMDVRPRTWSASMYLSHDAVGSLIESLLHGGLASSLVSTISPLSSTWSGMLLSVTAIQEGLRFDSYSTLDVTSQSAADEEVVQKFYTPPLEMIQLLPQETVVYLANSRFELFKQSLLSYAVVDLSENGAFFDYFEQSFGFSLQDELLNHLNGEWAIYAIPSAHGFLPEQANLNLAVGLLVQADDHINLQSISEKLYFTSYSLGINVENQQQDGITYYTIGNIGDAYPTLVFGQGNGYFALGTDIDALQISSSSDTSLVNSASYQKAMNALPAGMQPTMYVDLKGLLANLREGLETSELESFNQSVSPLEPIDLIAVANGLVQPGVTHSSTVVIISSK